MMDSQENKEELAAIQQGEETQQVVSDTAAEPDKAPDAAETTQDSSAGDDTTEPKRVYKDKKEIVERLKEIVESNETPQKDEVDYLKTVFYKLHFAEREAALKAYTEAGGDPESYKITPDEDEEAFKAEMAVIKEKRAKMFLEQEKEKLENLNKKLDIIEKIKAMVTSPEEANKSYQDFKKLQQEWKDIKLVPAEKANELWRNYQLYVEQYYDLLKLNSEAREYDFKKNLEIKTKLCEAAEKLADESDVISAFHQLQKLHQEYRETGPVAKELREEIWARFKAASTAVNKRHQQHFEDLRAKENENLDKKTALCEKAEAIIKEEIKNAADWEKLTKEIIAIQAEWKTIGFAPQKMNVKIFERFRAACDNFFGRKADFFKDLKQQFAANADKKQKLIDEAKALQDSTDWKTTGDRLIALQKEWKTIGTVPKKLGDKLWSEFLGACNHFFEARNNATAGVRNEEQKNLETKQGILEQLKALAENPGDDVQDKAHELIDRYNAVGHVPFKQKDTLYKEYHDILDRLYKELNVTASRRRLDKFRTNLKTVAEKGTDALDGERARLVRRYEAIRQEVQTYENNIGFLNVSSKKGNSLIDEMNRKVQKLKDEMNLVLEKIKAVDAENDD